MDGCEAAVHSAYAVSENAFIYPITPSTTMGEHFDEWATLGKKNIWGDTVRVDMLEHEGGAAGSLHGSVIAGNLSCSFTAAQGLLLKIPNMYIMAGELNPCVIHVAARALTKSSLSIHGDHQDVMSCRQTGWAMLASSSPQECMDLGLVSHLATLKARIPFLHFFDGMRTSHEISKVKPIPYEDIAKIFPSEALQKNLRKYQATPHNPLHRGLVHNPDVYFQNVVSAQKFYDMAPEIVEETMKEVGELTGREYNLFDYHGPENARRVIVLMGSGVQTSQETVDYLNKELPDDPVGVLAVRLYRPWSRKHFLQKLPKTVRKIAVMDRTREEGSAGLPLYLDVLATIRESPLNTQIEEITSGEYGLSSKEFLPRMVKASLNNLDAKGADTFKQRYLIGIKDDVTNTSLDYGDELSTIPPGTKQCIFWGKGSDGTIGANKSAIAIIANETNFKAQGFFEYDSYKTDGTTRSHLRFGPSEIKSEYAIQSKADYIACNQPHFVKMYDLIDSLKEGGVFVLNSHWKDVKAMESNLPNKLKKKIGEKKAKFYTINATDLAHKVGLGRRINMIMQSCFFKLSGVLPIDSAIELLKKDIHKLYKAQGEKVIEMNIAGVDGAFEHLKEIEYPSSWAELTVEEPREDLSIPEEVRNVAMPMNHWKGDSLPVSAFRPGGMVPGGSNFTGYEKRGIADELPVWGIENCTECNYCSLVCPHASIRPFLLDKKEQKGVPKKFPMRKTAGGLSLSILNSPYDCTGCGLCSEACPAEIITMTPVEEMDLEREEGWWKYGLSLSPKENTSGRETIKGSQFEQPLMEFSGACSGCGQTPYVKLLTQLFGERMLLANATGCSIIWGGVYPHLPYTTRTTDGKGPVYNNSLFEDNAEFGYGMLRSKNTRRSRLTKHIQILLDMDKEGLLSGKLREKLGEWLENKEDPEICAGLHPVIREELAANLGSVGESGLLEELRYIEGEKDLLTVDSTWIIGGDGWAYDIGYAGLDHILHSDANFNVFVMDNEMYANTGGQASKATEMGSSVKFNLGGKREFKKDLGKLAMASGNVYVGSIAMGANYSQMIDVLTEAESYPGPSLVLAFCPCIGWGIDMQKGLQLQKEAVDCGIWPLYSFDPRREQGDKFQLHSKKIKADLKEHLMKQLRYRKLQTVDPQAMDYLHEKLQGHLKERMEDYRIMDMDDEDMLDYLQDKLDTQASD